MPDVWTKALNAVTALNSIAIGNGTYGPGASERKDEARTTLDRITLLAMASLREIASVDESAPLGQQAEGYRHLAATYLRSLNDTD